MDYNFDLDDEKNLWVDDILGWIEDRHLLDMEEEDKELLDI
jgi:hypothetical protein